MLRLRAFGPIDLRTAEGHAVNSVLRQPKRLGLLVYLALENPRGVVTRDRVLGMLWPDQAEDRARASLNQALHYLRRSAGPKLVVTRGQHEIGLSSDAFWCDAVAFAESVAESRFEEALSLYQGELLPGFFVDRANEFQDWLDGQRRRFRGAACDAAWRLAEQEEAAGNGSAAGHWARRLLELAPDDELALQRALRLLVRVGDRAGALAAAEGFTARLATEFGAEPAAETAALIAELRTAPLKAAMSEVPGEGEAEAGPASSPGPGPAPNRSRPRAVRRRRPLAWLALAGVLAAGALWTWTGHGAGQRAIGVVPERPRIVVVPFEDRSPTRDLGHLTSALTSAIVERLSPLERMEVLAASSVPAAGPTGDVNGTSKGGGPGFLVTGGVVPSGGRIRITVAIVDAASGKTVSTVSLDRGESNVLDLVDEVSDEIASFLRVELGREIRLRRIGSGGRNESARELVRRAEEGRYRAQALEMEGATDAAAAGFEHADNLLRMAELQAPDWAEPVIRRAQVNADLAWLHFRPPRRDAPRARALMEKAVQITDRALRMDPRNASGLELRGMLRYWSWLIAPGDSKEAVAELRAAESDLRRAVETDPSRARAWTALSDLLFQRGEFNEAYWAARRAYDADAYLQNPREVLNRLFRAAHEIGADNEAQRWCDEMRVTLDRWVVAHCRLSLLAWSGRTPRGGEPWSLIEEVSETGSRMIEHWAPRFHLLGAAVLANAGLPDSAEAVLRRVTEQGLQDPELAHLEAFARLRLGQVDSAAVLLDRYIAGNPLARIGVLRSRRFQPLGAHPGLAAWKPSAE